MGHSARFIRPGSAMDQVFQDYRTLPSQLMIDATRWVAIGANGSGSTSKAVTGAVRVSACRKGSRAPTTCRSRI
jgi:hypothetical protein